VNTERRDFDSQAAEWDSDPGRVKLAGDIANAILEAVSLTPTMDIMDFGCGTGLLTLKLHPFVRSITGVDSSLGMLGVLNAKIDANNLSNVGTQYFDLDHGKQLEGRYDLIVSAMTLHHVREIPILLPEFYKVLVPAGFLCIADLDLDEGKFHETNEGVFHFGFDRESLRKDFLNAGFDDVLDTTAAKVIKPDAKGESRRFTVFLMTGRKKKA
jgi:2-polyprenyl-3-methyl-5-hydroxy-6-metoxy-1,4-benzoquinol methylase